MSHPTTSDSLRATHVQRDYRQLQHHTNCTLNEPATRITVRNFNYPDGWTPGTSDLLIRYPDHYPRIQPAIYLPNHLTYNGSVTHFAAARGDLADDWVRWCTHYIDWQDWRQYCHRTDRVPILTYLGLIRDSMNAPAASNPIKHASRRD